MRNRDIKLGNYVAYGRGSAGFLTRCNGCRQTIYMHMDSNGRWHAFESWVAGNADEGEFLPHHCGKMSKPGLAPRSLMVLLLFCAALTSSAYMYPRSAWGQQVPLPMVYVHDDTGQETREEKLFAGYLRDRFEMLGVQVSNEWHPSRADLAPGQTIVPFTFAIRKLRGGGHFIAVGYTVCQYENPEEQIVNACVPPVIPYVLEASALEKAARDVVEAWYEEVKVLTGN